MHDPGVRAAVSIQATPRLALSVILFAVLGACDASKPLDPTPSPTCTYALSASSVSVIASGGPASVTVTTSSGCAWSAVSNRQWIVVTSAANTTGPGTVALAVSANPETTARSGAVTVADQVLSVQQDGLPPCSIVLSAPGAVYSHDAGAGAFSVTTPAYCPWTAVTTAAWLSVTLGGQGTGNGTVTYAVERNVDSSARTAAIRVNETTFSVTQSGDEVACEYAVTPVEFTPCMSVPFEMTATVSTQPTCVWNATSANPWITVNDGQAGSGPGTITFRVMENFDAPRQGRIEVRWPAITAGQNLQVLQAGCVYGVSTTLINIPAAGGPGQFSVVQQSVPNTCGGALQDACVWTAASHVSWITISTPMPQKGDNPVAFVVAPNSTGLARSGTITVRDRVVTIVQPGADGTPPSEARR